MAKERVLAAMSGGVDSSVAAALLVEQGYEVIGVTMQVWPDLTPAEEARRGGCCSITAVNDARVVADVLGIPYYVLNLRETFERQVIQYFIDEYAVGRTPNPCIACNKHIKFDALLHKALELGCDYVATGHYARIERNEAGRYLLYRSGDPTKDQTYALYDLTQEQLARTLFPLGSLTKERVREMAAERGLATAQKPDSQEICFVLDNDYGAFVAQRAPETMCPGPIYDRAGNRLGDHRGLPHYTVGQRKGLGLTTAEPLYVLELRADDNALVVGGAQEVRSAGLSAGQMNWIAFDEPETSITGKAKIRYKADEADAVIHPRADRRVVVAFDEPQRAISPGQSVVFYQDDRILGGGVIEKSLSLAELQESEPVLAP